MSKSKPRTKYFRAPVKGYSLKKRSQHNPYRRDEMPRNRPSRMVTTHCSADVDRLQDATSFGGHSRQKGGHRRVSGLVRASLRRETRKLILSQLQDGVKPDEEHSGSPFRLDEGMWDNEGLMIQVTEWCTEKE